MSKDFGENIDYLGIEDEYEEVISNSSSVSPTTDLYKSVRNDDFEMEQQEVTEREDKQRSMGTVVNVQRSITNSTIPRILVREITGSNNNQFQFPTNMNNTTYFNQSSVIEKNNFRNNTSEECLAERHDDNNNNQRRSAEKSQIYNNEDSADAPTFEELTGGLPSITSTDLKNMLYFNDGIRRIDMVLVYEDSYELGVLNEHDSMCISFRNNFQESLILAGLELEIEDRLMSYDQKTCFVKVHAPYPIIRKYAALMHMKRPLKEGKEELSFEQEAVCFPSYKWFKLDNSLVSGEPFMYTSVFSHSNEDRFMVKDRESYYTSAQRSQIVWQIMLRTKFGNENNIGIRKLLNIRSYVSAFPLHEGKFDEDSECGYVYDRRILYLEWARPGRWYKNQPLWLVRKYFGDKIALYFAWLGFYTNMLILPSIVGLLCFIYGLVSMNSPENTPSKEICDYNIAGNITLCPLCDQTCTYQRLGDSCLFSNMTYLFDNPSTVFFSVFMSFWATSFLEMWKRNQALIAWQWDLHTGIEDEETRPEYDTSTKLFKINPVTRRKEPFVPPWERMIQICVSIIVVFLMILLVLMAVIATIIARLTLFTLLNDSDHHFVKTHVKLITSVMAALLNLFLIMILTKIYHHVAIWLTNQENPRTQTQYEKSFIVKIFLFEFMNYYSSLIYIAFFKGRFFTHPGDSDSRSSLILRLKGDVCDPAGCLSELCIQLAIIMIGKQLFNNLLELGFPAARNWWRNRIHKSAKKDPNKEYTHWEENYNLQDPGKLALFEEYLEMVIQYGFVTLFVAAFPLAPLFALLNNICEIRLDAYKMVAQARRPLAERVEDIGAWFSVLRGITYCAVVFNAFVIAYTSDYIPRKIYQYFYSRHYDLVGYIDSSLSVFNTSNFPSSYNKLSKDIDTEPEICQYRGYRYGPESDTPYELSVQYWIIFAFRLLFVVIFEHFVFSVTGILANFIPNVPYQVSRQIQLEKLLQKEDKFSKKYSNEEIKQELDDYDELLSAIKCAQNSAKISEVIRRGTWARKISRVSTMEAVNNQLIKNNDVD